jgi:hypothetical protein
LMGMRCHVVDARLHATGHRKALLEQFPRL